MDKHDERIDYTKVARMVGEELQRRFGLKRGWCPKCQEHRLLWVEVNTYARPLSCSLDITLDDLQEMCNIFRCFVCGHTFKVEEQHGYEYREYKQEMSGWANTESK